MGEIIPGNVPKQDLTPDPPQSLARCSTNCTIPGTGYLLLTSLTITFINHNVIFIFEDQHDILLAGFNLSVSRGWSRHQMKSDLKKWQLSKIRPGFKPRYTKFPVNALPSELWYLSGAIDQDNLTIIIFIIIRLPGLGNGYGLKKKYISTLLELVTCALTQAKLYSGIKFGSQFWENGYNI